MFKVNHLICVRASAVVAASVAHNNRGISTRTLSEMSVVAPASSNFQLSQAGPNGGENVLWPAQVRDAARGAIVPVRGLRRTSKGVLTMA